MSWIRLEELPDQRVVNAEFRDIVYWELRDAHVWHQGRKLRTADPHSFEVRTDDHVFLGRDRSQVFHAWQLLKGIDRATFEVLADGYMRDKNLAYCEYETSIKPLKGATLDDLAILGNGYARDAIHAYYWGKPIRSCRAPTTLTLPDEDAQGLPFALDRDNVYFESAALKGVNRAAWRLLRGGFSRDEKAVFFCARKLPGVRIDSWQHVGRAYSRDERSVYVMHLRVAGADPKTWQPLHGDYSRDKTHVYFVNRLLEGADAATFIVTPSPDDSDPIARDKHGSFDGEERVEA